MKRTWLWAIPTWRADICCFLMKVCKFEMKGCTLLQKLKLVLSLYLNKNTFTQLYIVKWSQIILHKRERRLDIIVLIVHLTIRVRFGRDVTDVLTVITNGSLDAILPSWNTITSPVGNLSNSRIAEFSTDDLCHPFIKAVFAYSPPVIRLSTKLKETLPWCITANNTCHTCIPL